MKYMFLIYVREELAARADPDILAEHVAFARDAIGRGAYVTCDALQPPATATTVRVRDGRAAATDGPFAETKEVLGGFYMLECRDLDEAMEYAANMPPARDGSIEIRPVADIPGWDKAIGLAPAAQA